MTTPLRGRTVSAGWLVLLLWLPWNVQAAKPVDVPAYLRSINHLHEEGEYERALHQIQLARQVSRGAEDEVTLSLHEGIILCEMGKRAQGEKAFESALLLQPDATLPVKVAAKIQKQFESVRQRVTADPPAVTPTPKADAAPAKPTPKPPPTVATPAPKAEPEPIKPPSKTPPSVAATPKSPSDEPRLPVLTPEPKTPRTEIVSQERTVPSTPITQRWYFWAGVGTVAAVAVTSALWVATKPLSPTDICGGACDAVANNPNAGVMILPR